VDRFVYFAILFLESNQSAIGGNFGKKQDALPSIVSLKRVLWAKAINFSTDRCWQLVVALRGGNSYAPPVSSAELRFVRVGATLGRPVNTAEVGFFAWFSLFCFFGFLVFHFLFFFILFLSYNSKYF
jgi:hypothetical protein